MKDRCGDRAEATMAPLSPPVGWVEVGSVSRANLPAQLRTEHKPAAISGRWDSSRLGQTSRPPPRWGREGPSGPRWWYWPPRRLIAPSLRAARLLARPRASKQPCNKRTRRLRLRAMRSRKAYPPERESPQFRPQNEDRGAGNSRACNVHSQPYVLIVALTSI